MRDYKKNSLSLRFNRVSFISIFFLITTINYVISLNCAHHFNKLLSGAKMRDYTMITKQKVSDKGYILVGIYCLKINNYVILQQVATSTVRKREVRMKELTDGGIILNEWAMETLFNEISEQGPEVCVAAMQPSRTAQRRKQQEHHGNPCVWLKQSKWGKITEQSVLSRIQKLLPRGQCVNHFKDFGLYTRNHWKVEYSHAM